MGTARWILAAGAAAIGLGAAPAAAQEEETTYYREETRVVTTGTDVEVEEADWARFRFGVSAHGGGIVNDAPDLVAGGLSLRLGIQLADLFAVYYQPMGLVGDLVDREADSGVAGLMFNTAMVDFTIFDMLSLGIGPSLDFAWGCDETIQEEIDCASSDVFFGGHGRVALNLFAMPGAGTRHAMTISFDLHPTVFDWDREVVGWTMLGGIGYEMF